MTDGSREPVLVLAVGNLLLQDDAAGLRLAALLAPGEGRGYEVVDGGTQGIALLGQLEDRRALIVLDAVSLGAAPGTVHVLAEDELGRLRARRETSAHEGNALTLLELSRLLGVAPASITVIGIEPESVRTGIGLSPAVEAALPLAMKEVACLLQELGIEEAVCA